MPLASVVPRPAFGALPWVLWFGFLVLAFYWAAAEGPGLANGPSTLQDWIGLLGTAVIWTGGAYLAARTTRRHPLGIHGWREALRAHGLVMAGFVVGYLAIGVVLDLIFDMPNGGSIVPRAALFVVAIAGLYTLMLAVLHAAEYGRRTRRKELGQLRLRRKLAEVEVERTRAELSAWRLELNPPTLLRALETIGSALRHDVAGARRILVHVSDFVRGTLDRLSRDTVLLEEELGALRSFVDLESDAGRCGSFSVDVAESELDAPVPQALLQTFVQRVLEACDGSGPPQPPDVHVHGRDGRLRVTIRGDGQHFDSSVGEEVLDRIGSRLGAAGSRPSVRRRDGAVVMELSLDQTPPRSPGGDPAAPSGPEPRAAVQSDSARAPRLSPRRRGLALAGWTLIFGVMAVRQLDRALYTPLVGGGVLGWSGAIWNAVISGAVWVAIPGLAIYCSRRYPLGASRTRRHLARHGLTVVGAAALLLAFRMVGYGVFGLPEIVALSFPGTVLSAIGAIFVIHFLVAAAAHVFWHVRQYRNREAEEARLQAELAETELRRARAELRTLKLQLNPHFLFNALNALYALIETDPDGAARLVTRLTDLLRRSMAAAGIDVVRLKDEVEFLKPFLDIEQLRLDGRVRVIWNVDDAALDTRVPHMILQPLVENAIKHGFSGGGAEAPRIEISARASARQLRLEVRDNGRGLRTGRIAGSHGIGLSNVERRLQELYGAAARFALTPEADGGAVAVVVVPLTN